MAQILQDNPGIGALLGTGIGQGLSQGLQQLAQIKTNQMLNRHQQRQTSRGLQALGFSPQDSEQISSLPQELQGLVLKNYLQASQVAGLEEALRGTQVNPQGISGSPELDQLVMAESAPQQQLPPAQRVAQMLGVQLPGILDKQLPSDKPFRDILAQQTQLKAQPQGQVRQPIQEQQQAPQQAKPNSLAEVLLRPRLTPEHRLKVEALKQQKDIAQQRLSAKEQEEVNKETKPFYDTVQKQARVAKDANARLDKFEDLIKRENLTSPVFAAFLKTLSNGIFGFGIDLSALMNADSQEFEKLSNDFIKDAKEFFPGRVTDVDLKAFLKTIPTLSQTRAGKLRVIKNMREFNAIKLAQKEASDKILKQTGGRRPRNFEQLVEELSAPEIDKIKKEFSNMAVPVDQRYFREFFNG